MSDKFLVEPGHKVHLSKIEAGYSSNLTPKELKKVLKEKAEKNIDKILLLQQQLYAESKQSLLVVLQALDAGGKDGTIRKVFGRINPQGCRVTSFKAPSTLEKSHDFLWRIHKEVPQKGMIGIFNRSHYEDVLVVRVHDMISKLECSRRYEYINMFERLLSDSGTRVLKFFLYISKDEQKRRFQERLDFPEKHWKFSSSDLQERAHWETYIKQFEEVLSETSTEYAPWHIVPANNKRYRDYIISRIVRKTLEDMNPRFPPPEPNLKDIVIP